MDSAEEMPANAPVFTWHPTYKGREVGQVRRDLIDEIGRDQRQYSLSLEGAELSEFASLSSVVELERRWGQFDFDWAESDPGIVADRILAFELDRDHRQEMIAFSDYRAELDDTGEEVAPVFAWKTKPVLVIGAIGIVVLVIILLLTL